MDDDAFINVPLFVEKYMTKEILNKSHHYIGRMLVIDEVIEEEEAPCPQAYGWFYALSWELLKTVNYRSALSIAGSTVLLKNFPYFVCQPIISSCFNILMMP